MIFTDVAHAAGQHDRLVIAAHFVAMRGADRLLEGTEVTTQRGPAELVVERRAAERAFDHDVERRDDALGLAVRHFPGLFEARDVQVRHGETGQPGLGLGTSARGAFVADFAARAGGRTREWRDGRRVVVGFDLHQDVHRLAVGRVFTGVRIRVEAPGHVTDDDRGVVLVGGQHAFAVQLIGVLDHAEQRLVLALAVDVPAGIEDLVTAVLGVGLREHHQFDVVRIAPQIGKAGHQIIDFIFGERQPQLHVGPLQCRATSAKDVDRRQRLGLGVAEQVRGVFETLEHQLSHAVVQRCGDLPSLVIGQLSGHVIGDAALEALDLVETAVAGDVAGLARPWRNRAETRDHQKQPTGRLLHRYARPVLQQPGEHTLFIRAKRAGYLGEMSKLGIQPAHGGDLLGQLCQELAMTEGGKSGSAAQDQHRRNSLGEGSSRAAYSSP